MNLAFWGFWTWVSFMRLAFESQDLNFFSKSEVHTRVPCEPRVLIIEHGSHVLSPVFKLQHLVYFHYFQDTDFVFFFSVRYSLNFLIKRNHFGHIDGADPNFVFSLRKTVPAFTGTNEEWQARLIKDTASALWELISNGRLSLRTIIYSENRYSFSEMLSTKMRRLCLTGTIRASSNRRASLCPPYLTDVSIIIRVVHISSSVHGLGLG